MASLYTGRMSHLRGASWVCRGGSFEEPETKQFVLDNRVALWSKDDVFQRASKLVFSEGVCRVLVVRQETQPYRSVARGRTSMATRESARGRMALPLYL